VGVGDTRGCGQVQWGAGTRGDFTGSRWRSDDRLSVGAAFVERLGESEYADIVLGCDDDGGYATGKFGRRADGGGLVVGGTRGGAGMKIKIGCMRRRISRGRDVGERPVIDRQVRLPAVARSSVRETATLAGKLTRAHEGSPGAAVSGARCWFIRTSACNPSGPFTRNGTGPPRYHTFGVGRLPCFLSIFARYSVGRGLPSTGRWASRSPQVPGWPRPRPHAFSAPLPASHRRPGP
jgi:hypothetical protein